MTLTGIDLQFGSVSLAYDIGVKQLNRLWYVMKLSLTRLIIFLLMSAKLVSFFHASNRSLSDSLLM